LEQVASAAGLVGHYPEPPGAHLRPSPSPSFSPPPLLLPLLLLLLLLSHSMPANLEVWLEALVDPDANGCGHVRLQLAGQKNDTVTYTPNANGTATCTVAKGSGTEFAYGPRAQFMSQELVRAFYK
jgi:hypothetical protein